LRFVATAARPASRQDPDTGRVGGGPADLLLRPRRARGAEYLFPAKQDAHRQDDRGKGAHTDRGIDQHEAAGDDPRHEDRDCRHDHRGAGPDHV
jgi:hypothetical protein